MKKVIPLLLACLGLNAFATDTFVYRYKLIDTSDVGSVSGADLPIVTPASSLGCSNLPSTAGGFVPQGYLKNPDGTCSPATSSGSSDYCSNVSGSTLASALAAGTVKKPDGSCGAPYKGTWLVTPEALPQIVFVNAQGQEYLVSWPVSPTMPGPSNGSTSANGTPTPDGGCTDAGGTAWAGECPLEVVGTGKGFAPISPKTPMKCAGAAGGPVATDYYKADADGSVYAYAGGLDPWVRIGRTYTGPDGLTHVQGTVVSAGGNTYVAY